MPPDSSCGKAPKSLPGALDPHLLEQFERSPRAILAARAAGRLECIAHLIADAADRIERSPRVLEDERDAASAHLCSVPAVATKLAALEPNAATIDAAVAGKQSDQAVGHDGFSGATLADNAERLAGHDRQRYAVDGVDAAAMNLEADGKVLDLEKRRGSERSPAGPHVDHIAKPVTEQIEAEHGER